MNKRQFQDLLDRSDSSLMRAAEDLGVCPSTVSRWTDRVPGYAEWDAIARTILTPEQLAKLDGRFRRRARQLADAW